jgi:hypothetical protein
VVRHVLVLAYPKVATKGAATEKSKGYARIINKVILRYFQQLSQTEKTQNVGK